jgi:hypothetical protein
MGEGNGRIMETPFGVLYAPQRGLMQAVVLLAVFVGTILAAEIIARMIGDLSRVAGIVLYTGFVACLFAGYGLWSARLKAIAFHGVGKALLKALFLLLVRRRRPESIEDLLPTEEKLTQMAVAAQQSAPSFKAAGLLIGVLLGLSSLLFEASGALRFLLAAGGLIGWSYLLYFLGRRGYLPILESGG